MILNQKKFYKKKKNYIGINCNYNEYWFSNNINKI